MNRSGAALFGVWLVGVAAYTVAITNRTALSALGLDTAQHFAIDPATLSLFAVMQLAVYGALQLPIGIVLDRLGPRTVLSGGMLVLAAAQITLALAPGVEVAIVARLLLGAGDAAIFPSLLRVIGIRFPPRRAPLMVQMTGLLGQFGQIISVIPFAALVRTSGWATGFLSLASLTAFLGVLAWVVIREKREPGHQHLPMRLRVRDSWREPGTRLGFWTHFVTPFAGTSFAVLWGYPFLLSGQGLDRSTAELLFTIYVLFGLVASPVVGTLSGRYASHRVAQVLVFVGIQVAAWAVVLAFPGPAPLPVLVVLAAAMCVGGPASMLAFDFAREHNPSYRLSTATGIVNGAGFLSSVLVILLIGLVLNTRSAAGDEYGLGAFRVAELVQIPFWVLGIGMIIRESRATRAHALVSTPAGPVRRPSPTGGSDVAAPDDDAMSRHATT